jgi:serine/threonine-protein kinase
VALLGSAAVGSAWAAKPPRIAVVERAMAKKPDERFPSAADMSAALDDQAGPSVAGPDAAATVMAGPATEIFASTVVPVPSGPAPTVASADRHPAPGRPRRRRVLAIVAVAGLAVSLGVAARVRSQHGTSVQGTPTTTVAPTAARAQVPPALNDALLRLEKTVR